MIRATTVATINQVGTTELFVLSCLAADQRCDTVNASRAVDRHIAVKLVTIISGLPRAQKCSAKNCSSPVQAMRSHLGMDLARITCGRTQSDR
jgi:hypothetical protein